MLPITIALLDNYNRPKKKLKSVKGIVIHWTANTSVGANAIRNRNYFNTKPYIKGPNGEKVYASAHYIVDEESIVQCIPDDELAYHVGAKFSSYKALALSLMSNPQPGMDSPNNYLIGIEMCVNSDGDFDLTKKNSIELIRHLMAIHGLNIEQVHRHYDITGKLCPKMYIEDAKWQSFKTEIIEGNNRINNSSFQKGKVNTAILNVREGPGTDNSVVDRLTNELEIDILEKKGKWLRIGEARWVHGDYVLLLN